MIHGETEANCNAFVKSIGHSDERNQEGLPAAIESSQIYHLDWELIGKCAEKLSGTERKALADAYDRIEDQEDEHLYHSKGWCRELWIKSLGMHAILPPPEEVERVKTAKQAAEAEERGERAR